MYTEYVFENKKYEVALRDIKATLFDIVSTEEAKIAELRTKAFSPEQEYVQAELQELFVRQDDCLRAILNISNRLTDALKKVDSCSRELKQIEDHNVAQIIANVYGDTPQAEEQPVVDEHFSQSKESSVQSAVVPTNAPYVEVQVPVSMENEAPVAAEQVSYEEPVMAATSVEPEIVQEIAEPEIVQSEPVAEPVAESAPEAATTEAPAEGEEKKDEPVTLVVNGVEMPPLDFKFGTVAPPAEGTPGEENQEGTTTEEAKGETTDAKTEVGEKKDEPVTLVVNGIEMPPLDFKFGTVAPPAEGTPGEENKEGAPAEENKEAAPVEEAVMTYDDSLSTVAETTPDENKQTGEVISTESTVTPDASSNEVIPTGSSDVIATDTPVIQEESGPVLTPIIEESSDVISTDSSGPVLIPDAGSSGDVLPVIQESSDVILPAASPAEETPATPAFDTEGVTEILHFKKRATDDLPKVIMISSKQAANLRRSLSTQEALLSAKGMFGSKDGDASLEQQLMSNGLLESDVNTKQAQIESLMKEATELYAEGKIEEAQNVYTQISDLNKELQGESAGIIK